MEVNVSSPANAMDNSNDQSPVNPFQFRMGDESLSNQNDLRCDSNSLQSSILSSSNSGSDESLKGKKV